MTFNDFPMSPSVNAMYLTRGRRRVLSPQARKFKEDCQLWKIQNQVLVNNIRNSLCEKMNHSTWIVLDCFFGFPKEKIWTKDGRIKKLDAENRLKATLDGVSEVLGIDDRYFCVGRAEKVATIEESTMIVFDVAPIQTMDQAWGKYLNQPIFSTTTTGIL